MSSHSLTSFYYLDQLHIRVVPAKRLFNSTLIHEVVNRGDVFAMRVHDQTLTIVPGDAQVTHTKIPHSTPLTLSQQLSLDL